MTTPAISLPAIRHFAVDHGRRYECLTSTTLRGDAPPGRTSVPRTGPRSSR
jgi:hypothetical protein